MVLWVGLQCVFVVFPGCTHFFLYFSCNFLVWFNAFSCCRCVRGSIECQILSLETVCVPSFKTNLVYICYCFCFYSLPQSHVNPDLTLQSSSMSLMLVLSWTHRGVTQVRIQRGGGVDRGSGPPLENHKLYGFL